MRCNCAGQGPPFELKLTTDTEGTGNAACALHPRSRVQNCAKKRTRAYRFSGGNPAFPAQLVLTAYAVLSPATNVCRPRTVSIKRLRWAVHAQRALTESGSVAVRRSRFTCRSQAEARPAIRLARRHAADPLGISTRNGDGEWRDICDDHDMDQNQPSSQVKSSQAIPGEPMAWRTSFGTTFTTCTKAAGSTPPVTTCRDRHGGIINERRFLASLSQRIGRRLPLLAPFRHADCLRKCLLSGRSGSDRRSKGR
jgi:hypothetical protein